MSTTLNWTDAKRLLAIRLDSLGDVIMTGPALRALKETVPGRHLALLTSPAGASAGALLPDVDEVLIHEVPWMKATPPRSGSQPEWELVELLRRRRFDAAVVFTVYSQNPLPAAMLCYLADIPLRLACCRENPYQLLTHWVPECEPDKLVRHEVKRQLDLVGEVGCQTTDERLRLRIPDEARRWAVRTLKDLDMPLGGRWLVLHPGASAPSRRYPPEQFAAAAAELAELHGWRILVTGSDGERALVEQVFSAIEPNAARISGDISIAQLAAILALARVVVTNNTGPAHIAAAVGTPVVDLYALTNPQHTPWAVPSRVLFHDVPCKFCYRSVCPEIHHDCLRKVPPAAIVEAVLDLHGTRESSREANTMTACKPRVPLNTAVMESAS